MAYAALYCLDAIFDRLSQRPQVSPPRPIGITDQSAEVGQGVSLPDFFQFGDRSLKELSIDVLLFENTVELVQVLLRWLTHSVHLGLRTRRLCLLRFVLAGDLFALFEVVEELLALA